MKKFKKLMSALLACAMLLAIAIPVVSVAAEDKVEIRIETVEGATAGQKNVEVKLYATADPHWSAIDFNISYDPAKLTFKNIVYNQAIKDQQDDGENVFPMLNKDDAVNGNVIIVFMTTTKVGGYEGYYNVDNSGEAYDYVGTMKFDVAEGVEDGTYDITCTLTKCSGIVNDVQQDIPYEITNGAIKVGDGGEEPPVDPCDHEWGEWEVTTPATCVAKGEKTRTCSKCQETETEEIDIDPDAHDWGEWEDCPDEEGYEQRVCKNDPEHIEKREKEGGEEPPVTGDKVKIVVETVEGATAGQKNVEVKLFVTAEPHWSAIDFNISYDPAKLTFKNIVYNQAIKDQQDDGENVFPMLNKDDAVNGNIIIVFMTTTKVGGYEGYYNVDNSGEAYDYVGTMKFDVAEGVEDGTYDIACTLTKCSGIVDDVQQDIPYEITNGAIIVGAAECEHDWVETDRVAATCTEAGKITYTCSKCQETKEETIDPLDHDWGEWEVTKPATCTEKGEETRTCQREGCNETETREIDIDPDAHDWVEIGREEPTCAAKGSVTYACSRCLEQKTEDIDIDPDAHDWGEWEPIEGREGWEQRVCKNDPSHVEEREVETPPVHEHTFGEPTYTWAEDNSTCTATRTCTGEGCEEVETETVNTTSETTPATTEAEGKTVYTATFTNSAFETQTKEVTIPKLTPEEPEKTEPEVTGIEDGKTYDVGKGEKPAPTWEPEDAEGTLNGEPYTAGTEITEPGEYELVVKNGDKTTTIKFTVTDSTATEEPTNPDQPNTSDIAVAGIAIVALIASAAVVVIARKKRFAR